MVKETKLSETNDALYKDLSCLIENVQEYVLTTGEVVLDDYPEKRILGYQAKNDTTKKWHITLTDAKASLAKDSSLSMFTTVEGRLKLGRIK